MVRRTPRGVLHPIHQAIHRGAVNPFVDAVLPWVPSALQDLARRNQASYNQAVNRQTHRPGNLRERRDDYSEEEQRQNEILRHLELLMRHRGTSADARRAVAHLASAARGPQGHLPLRRDRGR